MILFVSVAVGSLLAAGVALLRIRRNEMFSNREVVTRKIENPNRINRNRRTHKNH